METANTTRHMKRYTCSGCQNVYRLVEVTENKFEELLKNHDDISVEKNVEYINYAGTCSMCQDQDVEGVKQI